MSTHLSDILQLSISERIQLVEDIWDSIATVPESIEINEEQTTEIESRLEAYTANTSEGISWNNLKGKLQRRY